MEKFTRIISIQGNYAYNTIGETFYVTNDLLPMSIPCVITYNPEWTSSIRRSEIMEDDGEEWFYTLVVRHVERAFSSMEELHQYRKTKWEEIEIVIAEHKRILSKLDFSELVAF
jgi:hypothetical protein